MHERVKELDAGTPERPYIGLRPYSKDDSNIYYGRDRNAHFLTNKIFSSRLTLLYGKSGLGKSSLLHAKVTPELDEDATLVLYFDQWAADSPSLKTGF